GALAPGREIRDAPERLQRSKLRATEAQPGEHGAVPTQETDPLEGRAGAVRARPLGQRAAQRIADRVAGRPVDGELDAIRATDRARRRDGWRHRVNEVDVAPEPGPRDELDGALAREVPSFTRGVSIVRAHEREPGLVPLHARGRVSHAKGGRQE